MTSVLSTVLGFRDARVKYKQEKKKWHWQSVWFLVDIYIQNMNQVSYATY